ncbi:MAG: acyl-CoA dehydrogenase family protein [Deltaproteobacteria bacterium]|nr:acyl-CoA dehydrogenase family protein [Deltaproteobacteria bacterium]
MDFGFNEEQEMLRNSARSFFERECPTTFVRKMLDDPLGYSPAMWRKIAEMGWTGLLYPEKYGGLGLGMVDLVVVLEEMGRALLPSPFLSTIIEAGSAILLGATEAQRKRLLPQLISGEKTAAFALAEPNGSLSADGIAARAVADRRSGGFVIDGVKALVQGAPGADLLVVAARTRAKGPAEKAVSLFLVDAGTPGVTVTPLPSVDGTRRVGEVRLRSVKVGKDALLGRADAAWPVVMKVLDRANVALCAEQAGLAQICLELTVEYAKTRVQFGKPIGVFQAIKHPCAEMLLELESSKSAVYYAAWALDHDPKAAPLAVAMAKSYAGEAGYRIAARSIQLHGGIGFTWEHDLHLYFKRAKTTELTYGGGTHHREQVARAIGL